MRKFRFVTIVSTLALVLAGCGGGGEDSKFSDPGTSPGTGGGGGNTNTATAITAISSVPTLPSDGSASAEITAFVRDANNNLVPNVAVTFTPSSGGIAVTQGTTDSTGAAHATLSTVGDSTLRTITVTAKTGSLTATVNVQVVSGGTSTTTQMGSLVGSTFTPGSIAIGASNLSAGGSTSLQVALQKSDGTLFSQSTDVTFTSPCVAQGLAQINSPVTTTTGIASATYTAKGCSGTDVITATATVNSSPVSASGTVTVATAAIGSIQFEAVSPALMGLKGTGRNETSTVSFLVKDSSGGARANADVTFSLDTSVGGITLTSNSATSDANGRVTTVVNSGTVATTVRVTARIASPNITTQSNILTVSTGIPDTDSFTLGVTCPNVEAYNHNGVNVAVTAQLADRFNNPVPDGTAVNFKAEGGSIVAQCTTGTAAAGNGACTVNWTSQDPRPQVNGTGRVSILATAIGEDTFTDNNSNGYYDAGEPFVDPGEPFRNDNDLVTPVAYDVGEFFLDFNNNGSRDASDGVFSGVTCTGTTAGSTCNLTTTSLGASTLIIMSTDGAAIAGPVIATGTATYNSGTGVLSIPHDTTAVLRFNIKDGNGNAMANGTTIASSTSGDAGQLSGDTDVVVPCDESTDGQTITLSLKAGSTTPASGLLTIKVTSKPGGLITSLQIPVNIT